MVDDLSVNLEMGLCSQEGWVPQCSAGLLGHLCILFSSVVAVNVKCFNDSERMVGFLVLVTFNM